MTVKVAIGVRGGSTTRGMVRVVEMSGIETVPWEMMAERAAG